MNFPAEWIAAIPAFALVALRVGVVMTLLPAPFSSVAPAPQRAILSLVVAAAIVLGRGSVPTLGLDPIILISAGLGEAMIGATIGLPARIAIASAEAAGDFTANAIGLGAASTLDPTHGESSPAIGVLFSGIAALIFFEVGGHHAVIAGVAASLDHAPPGQALAALNLHEIPDLGASLVGEGLRIASPIVGTMLVVQVAVGLVARASPRVQIFNLSFAAAAGCGLLVLLAAAPHVVEAITVVVRAVPDRVLDAIEGPRGG